MSYIMNVMRCKYDLYISYSRADYDGARMIVDVLQKQGYSCFVDFDELDAGEIEKQLFDAINNSRCLLLVYSQHVESSQYIRREVEFALENGIKILPILLSEFKEVSWYKERFANVNCIRICDGVLPSEVIEQLLHCVKSILGESEQRESSSRYSSESMLNFALSANNHEEDIDYSPKSSTDINVTYVKRSKRGCIILIAILFAIIGLGFFFSNWFVCYSPSHPYPSWSDSIYIEGKRTFGTYRRDTINIDTIPFEHSMINPKDNPHQFIIEETKYSYVILDSIYQLERQGFYVIEAKWKKDSIQWVIQQLNSHGPGCGNILRPQRDSSHIETPEEIFVDDNASTEDYSGIEDNNYTTIFALSIVIFVSCSLVFYFYRKSKRKNVKITCNKSAIINIDGNPIAELEAHKVHPIHLPKGRYIVDFQLISDKSKHETMPLDVSKVSEDLIVEGKFQSLLNEQNTIKVFIAGSTRLVAERDALRSVIGQMYNKYKEDNLLIEAYSFDDFPREFTEGGHQKLYDEFIRQEANWVVFITDGEIGDKTIRELENAIKAYKSGKRPKILMYSKPEKTQSSQQMNSFRKLLLEENQYWIDYNSLIDIKTSFRDHLQWDLYNLMKSQYKKIS